MKIITWIKLGWTVVLLDLTACAWAQSPPYAPASQSEVNAGLNTWKGVTPATLAGYSLQQSTGSISAATATNIAQAISATNNTTGNAATASSAAAVSLAVSNWIVYQAEVAAFGATNALPLYLAQIVDLDSKANKTNSSVYNSMAVTGIGADGVRLAVRKTAGQTYDVFQVQDNSNNRLWSVDADGVAQGSGAGQTNLNASELRSGTVATARLGSGTANASTYLSGDQTWKTISASTGVPTNTYHGSLVISNRTTSSDFTTSRAVTNWTRIGPANGVGGDIADGTLRVTNAGTYLVVAQISFDTTTQPTDINGEIYVGAVATGLRFKRDMTANGASGSASVVGMLSLAASDLVSLQIVASPGTETLTIEDAQLVMTTFGGGTNVTSGVGTNGFDVADPGADGGWTNLVGFRWTESPGVLHYGSLTTGLYIADPAAGASRFPSGVWFNGAQDYGIAGDGGMGSMTDAGDGYLNKVSVASLTLRTVMNAGGQSITNVNVMAAAEIQTDNSYATNFYPDNFYTGITNAPTIGTDANGKLQAGVFNLTTNATATGVLACGQTTFINITSNSTLSGFSGVNANYNQFAKLALTNGTATAYSYTVPASVATSTNTFVLGKAFWVTNGSALTINFDIAAWGTNAAAVRWTP